MKQIANMKEVFHEILISINNEIDKLNLDGVISIDNAVYMLKVISPLFGKLQAATTNYQFQAEADEVYYFKKLKPAILGKYLFFSKIYNIESQMPIGNKDVIKHYLSEELNSLTHYFYRNKEFYQYYRTEQTYSDSIYFVRGNCKPFLCSDSVHIDKDPRSSTGYDYKVAKILANEQLQKYLEKRIQSIERIEELTSTLSKLSFPNLSWTGKKVFLIELGYSLYSSCDINGGKATIGEIMDALSILFNIDLGDYYRVYLNLKSRKKDRTSYLNSLIDKLIKRMNEDDAK